MAAAVTPTGAKSLGPGPGPGAIRRFSLSEQGPVVCARRRSGRSAGRQVGKVADLLNGERWANHVSLRLPSRGQRFAKKGLKGGPCCMRLRRSISNGARSLVGRRKGGGSFSGT